MALSDKTFIWKKRDEMAFLVKMLREFYDNDKELNKNLKKCSLYGDDIATLKKHPERVTAVFLPMIQSYGEYGYEFQEAVSALAEKGIDEFNKHMGNIRTF